MFSKKQFFYVLLTIIGISGIILNSIILYFIHISWNKDLIDISNSNLPVPQASFYLSHNAKSGLTKYSTDVLDSILEMIRSYTDDISDARDWVIENFPSVFTNNIPKVEEVVKEYIKSRISKDDNWIVVRHDALPNHQLRYKNLPLRIDYVNQYVGYIDTETSSLFFWFVESRGDPRKDPLIIWFNGGPGCSSLIGFFEAIGPSKWSNERQTMYYNPYSWNDISSLIALDQPANTGFSYSSQNIHSTTDAATDFYAFLTLLYKHFPYTDSLPLHLAGESYAGHYLPVFASALIEANEYANDDGGEISDNQSVDSSLHRKKKALKYEKLKTLPLYSKIITSLQKRSDFDSRTDSEVTPLHVIFPLKSLMIGNGLVDPTKQMPYNYMVGCSGRYGHIFTPSHCKQLEKDSNICRRYMLLCEKLRCPCICTYAYRFCAEKTLNPYKDAGRDIYDVRKKCKNCTFLNTESLEAYLNQPKVQERLGVHKPYSICNFSVTSQFYSTGEMAQGVVNYVAYVLESKIPILLFSGDADAVCNWHGTYIWAHAMEWSGSKNFMQQKLRPWLLRNNRGKKPKGTQVGEVKSHAGLTLVRVYEAGHAAGADQPEGVFDLYLRWLGGDYAFKGMKD